MYLNIYGVMYVLKLQFCVHMFVHHCYMCNITSVCMYEC